VPGKRITDLQVSKYKELRGKHGQEAAAAKTGISVASAWRLESAVVLPSQRPPRHWRTRADPLAEVWDAEVVPMSWFELAALRGAEAGGVRTVA